MGAWVDMVEVFARKLTMDSKPGPHMRRIARGHASLRITELTTWRCVFNMLLEVCEERVARVDSSDLHPTHQLAQNSLHDTNEGPVQKRADEVGYAVVEGVVGQFFGAVHLHRDVK